MLASGSPPHHAAGPVRTPSFSSDASNVVYNTKTTTKSGRTIPPTRVRGVTTVESITSTISALSKHASTGISTLSTAAAARDPLARYKTNRHSQQDGGGSLGTDAMSSSPSPIFDAMGGNADPTLDRGRNEEDVLAGKLGSMNDILGRTERVSWSAWDSLPIGVEPGSSSRHALLVAYASGGLQIFTHGGAAGKKSGSDRHNSSSSGSSCSSHLDLREVLNFQQFLLPGDHVAGRVLAAKLHRTTDGQPCLLLVTATVGESDGLTLSQCSLQSQMVTKSTPLPRVHSPEDSNSAAAVSSSTLTTSAIQLGRTYLVVAQSHPPALHVRDLTTLASVMDPIVDVASASLSSNIIPAFHLSGRMLAYASTTLDKTSNFISFKTATRNSDSSVLHSSSCVAKESQYTTAEQMRLSAIEAGAQASDLAKKVGGGLMAGAKNLGGWGSSYVSAYAGPASSSAQDTTLQQNSPYSHEFAAGLPPLLSPPVHSPKGNHSPRLTTDSAVKQTSRSEEARVRKASTIRILDLMPAGSTKDGPSVRLAVSFRPSSANIATIKLDPTSSHVFVADSVGHFFNIFEIRSRPRGLPSNSHPPPALHRYKLLRGVTTAHVCDAQWTHNGKWLSVLTYNGTAHVYRLGPADGPKALYMGATLTSFARTPRPRQTMPQESCEVPSTNMAPTESPLMESYLPSAMLFANAPGLQPTRGLDVLCFHPSVAALTLSRVTLARATLAENLVTSASDATNRVSGLTVMMRRATMGGEVATGRQSATASPSLRGNNGQSTRYQPQPQKRRLHGECSALAIWSDLARTHDAPEVQPSVFETQASASHGHPQSTKAPHRGWASLAEIETYDSAPRALPTSIYLCHQIKLCIFTHPVELPVRSEPLLLDLPRSRAISLQTREGVVVDMALEEGTTGSSSFSGLTSAIASPAFNAPEFCNAQSPSQRIPSFPQGQAARRPGWRKSVAQSVTTPIRITAAASKDIVGSLRKPGAKTGSMSSFSRSSPRNVGLSFDEDISYDAHIFADARKAPLSPNGGPSSLVSTGGISPSGGAATTSTDSGSADTAATTISETLEDDMEADDEETYWAAARGMQEDVEGDQLGWDSFAEFNAKGANGHRKDNAGHEDFLVGGLALDEDVNTIGVGAARGTAASLSPGPEPSPSNLTFPSPSMPPFSRKSLSNGTSFRSGSGSFTPGRNPASLSSGESNAEGAQSGSEGSKHTSLPLRSSGGAAVGSSAHLAAPATVPAPALPSADVTAPAAITINKGNLKAGSLPSPNPATLALSQTAAPSSLSSSSSSSTFSSQRKGKKK